MSCYVCCEPQLPVCHQTQSQLPQQRPKSFFPRSLRPVRPKSSMSSRFAATDYFATMAILLLITKLRLLSTSLPVVDVSSKIDFLDGVSGFAFLRPSHIPPCTTALLTPKHKTTKNLFLYHQRLPMSSSRRSKIHGGTRYPTVIVALLLYRPTADLDIHDCNDESWDDVPSLRFSKHIGQQDTSTNSSLTTPTVSFTPTPLVKLDNFRNTTTTATVTTTTAKDQIVLPPSVTSSLGDIMSIATTAIHETATAVSPTNTTGSRVAADDDQEPQGTIRTSLQERYQIHHPLNRVILTANGNVQRLISSYYDTKYYEVQVNVIHCQLRPPPRSNSTNNNSTIITPTATTATTIAGPNNNDNEKTTRLPHIWDRQVELCLYSTTTPTTTNHSTKHVFGTATSVITIYDPECQQLIESQQIGIGQLFRYYNILPNFTLHDAGPLTTTTTRNDQVDHAGGGNFWREYTLSSSQLSCWIREEFPPGLWNISNDIFV